MFTNKVVVITDGVNGIGKCIKEEFLKQFGGLDMIQYDLEMRKTIDSLKEFNK